MSVLSELSRRTVQEWRDFAGTPAFTQGIDFLRHNHAPTMSGDTEAAMLKSALGWNAYQKALSDVEEILTALPKQAASLDEPSLSDQ